MRGGVKGNRGGQKGKSGRKSRADEMELAGLLDRVWTLQDREDVLKALHAKAVDGNEKAASLLLAYAYGRPPERIQHENPDGTSLLSPIADALMKIYGASITANQS